MDKREKFWTVLLISAIIAAIVSFFTTAFGLLYYISFFLAIPLALAVQMGLFGLAWLVGFGYSHLRPMITALYFVTMVFSVIFSYVFLQSELVEKVKPRETQRMLFDDIRSKILSVEKNLNEGVNESEAISTRLNMWLKMEVERGWATKTCENEKHCYLLEVCKRVRGKIELWEKKFGRPYREGPGRELIYGALNEEYNVLVQIHNRLKKFRDEEWSNSNILSENIDNRQRLIYFDQLIGRVPKKDLEAILCREVDLPNAPKYEDYARDTAIKEEKQVYAFDDLIEVFEPGRSLKKSDYPTIFAFGLSIFIDLFVLIVALGAAITEYRKPERSYPDIEALPSDWNTRIRENISEWIDGALLTPIQKEEERIEFVRKIIKSIKLDREGRSIFIPLDEEQFRFGIMLVKSEVAEISHIQVEGKEKSIFILEDWIYLALTRYVHLAEEASR